MRTAGRRFQVASLLTLVFLIVGSATAGQDEARDFKPIFNGKDLSGWDGDGKFWSVKDGVLIGQSTAENPCKRNTFLIWRGGKVTNFELRLKFRITSGNSGIQFRSRDLGEWKVNGMQADMEAGINWTGGLYEEGGRGIITRRGQRVRIDAKGQKTVEKIGDSAELLKKAPIGKWNEYRVLARERKITLEVNDVLMSELHDNPDRKVPSGIIALQLHAGPPMKVEYKDIRLRRLSPPDKSADDTADEDVPNWIWLGPEAKPGQELYFRRVIDVAGPVSEARIVGSCDNHMQVYINEQAVLSSSEWQKPLHARVDSALAPGRNVIAVWARNDGGPAGLLLELTWKTQDGSGGALVTNESWLVSAERGDGWNQADFDDSGWSRASSRGRLDERLAWQRIDRAALDSAAQGSAISAATPAKDVVTLPGFDVELLYSVPRWQGSWVSLTTDGKGRLIASDQYGGLFRITPAKIGDGEAKTQVEQLELDIGEAQGLLYAFDSLYVVVTGGGRQGGLYRARDTDGDDRFDQVELLRPLTGVGEHGPHGIVLGPDGKSLYIVAGNHVKLPDFVNTGRVPRVWGEDNLLQRRWDPGGHAVGVMAPGGWICRIDPDAQDWELIAIGFRNTYDIAFSRDGELFTYDADMEWDIGLPWYRPTRICHVVSGAEFGWRSGSAKWPEFYPDSVPPVVNIGLASPTGVVFGDGAKFPDRYERAFFAQDWTFGVIYAVHLEPSGSGYSASFERFVSGKPLPVTDMVIGHDGAMYFTIGGRRMQSGLYRVTHDGSKSISDAPAPDADVKRHAAARALRRRLESLHREDASAVDVAWPHLGSPDRLIRYAARIAIEHQDVSGWQSRALGESSDTAATNALLALVRHGDASLQVALLERLNEFPLASMTETQVLEALRVYSLAFIRMGKPDQMTARAVLSRLEPMFPSRSVPISRELCRLLVYLDSAKVVGESVRLIEGSPTQEDRIHYAFVIRKAQRGWNPALRRKYFGWINGVLGSYSGGASFRKYIDFIKQEAVAALSEQELAALDEIINAPIPVSSSEAVAPRRYVHNWQMEDLLPLLDQVSTNRSFERGKLAYRDTSCLQCHRFAGEGGNTGHDLTSASGRLSPRDLLESIILPSRVISDQYQDMRIVTKTHGVIAGQIESETGEAITVRTHPLAEETIEISRGDIESIAPSKTSRMPTELLSTLEKEEVLDLLAYILSGGKRDDPAFRRQD